MNPIGHIDPSRETEAVDFVHPTYECGWMKSTAFSQRLVQNKGGFMESLY
jgi:hypothetical protein